MSAKRKLVVEAIENGTVIDHIPADRTLQVVRLLTKIDDCYFLGVNLSSASLGKKGIIKIENVVLDERQLELLAALAPQASLNVIKDFEIIKKFKLSVPSMVRGLFICPNTSCITNHENVSTKFLLGVSEHTCQYCERSFLVHRLDTVEA